MNKKTLIKTIKERLEATGLTAAEASKRATGSRHFIANIGRERYGMPSIENLSSLADVLGFELYIGPARTEAAAVAQIFQNHGETAKAKKLFNMGDDAAGQIKELEVAEGKEAIAATSEYWKDQAAAIRKHYTFVNLHEIQASAGSGYINGHEDQPSSLAFSNTWLKRIGINPDAASLIYVADDSMEPTLKGGSIVLIDHQQQEPIGKHIYAIRDGDALLVKRLEITGGQTLLLTSDNPKYTTQVLTGFDLDAVGIVGKVVWSAFTLGD